MATHSSTLAWKISWTEEPGRLQSMGSLRVRHDWATSLSLFLSCIGEGNGNPLQCSCLENPRDRGAWWAAVYGVAQSRTRLKRFSSSSSTHTQTHTHTQTCTSLFRKQVKAHSLARTRLPLQDEGVVIREGLEEVLKPQVTFSFLSPIMDKQLIWLISKPCMYSIIRTNGLTHSPPQRKVYYLRGKQCSISNLKIHTKTTKHLQAHLCSYFHVSRVFGENCK